MCRTNGRLLLAIASVTCATFAVAVASDWNQWRGPNRDGVDPSSPPLIEHLPDDGLKPIWLSESIPAGGKGGWGSPAVADGKVFLFAHYHRTRAAGMRFTSDLGQSDLRQAESWFGLLRLANSDASRRRNGHE